MVVFDRSANGTLTRKPGVDGCISNDGTGTACVDGRGLADVSDVTVSPDGKTVYVVGGDISAGAVAVFDRAADGTLEQLPGTAGCISEDGSDGCFDGAALAVRQHRSRSRPTAGRSTSPPRRATRCRSSIVRPTAA